MSRSVWFAASVAASLLAGPAAAESADWRLCAMGGDVEADRSIAACSRLVAVDTLSAGERATAYFNRGNFHLRKGEHGPAIRDFTETLRLDPNNSGALNNRGLAHSSQGEFDRAIQDFDQAIRLDARNTAALYNRASAYHAKGDLERAIRDFGHAIRLDPADPAAFIGRGLAHADKGDYDAAIKDYGTAHRLDPRNVVALNHRADAYAYTGEFVRALADYDAAVGINPRYALAFRNRARVHFYRGDFAAAAADFHVAEGIDPGNSYSLIWRYFAEARSGTTDPASLHRALPVLRDGWPKPVVLYLLGRMEAAAALAAAGAAADERARQAQLCEAHFFIGQQNILAGADDAARAALRQALALCPRNVVEYHATRVELRRIGTPP